MKFAALRREYTSRFGSMVEEERPNLVSNGLCVTVSIVVRLKQLSASVSTSPNTACYIPNELYPPADERQPFGLKCRKGHKGRVALIVVLSSSKVEHVDLPLALTRKFQLYRLADTVHFETDGSDSMGCEQSSLTDG